MTAITAPRSLDDSTVLERTRPTNLCHGLLLRSGFHATISEVGVQSGLLLRLPLSQISASLRLSSLANGSVRRVVGRQR